MKKVLIPALGIAALAAAGGTALAEDNGAHKANFVDTPFTIYCSGQPPVSTPTQSFAIIKRDGNNTVSADVVLKNAVPNTTYEVTLLGTNNGTCNGAGSGQLTTNDQGNGNTRVSMPQTPGDNEALVTLYSPSDWQQTPDVPIP